MPKWFQGCPWCWPDVNNLASSSLQIEDIPKVVQNFGSFWGCFRTQLIFPVKGSIFAYHVIPIQNPVPKMERVRYFGTLFVHSVMRQIFCNAMGLIWKLDIAVSAPLGHKLYFTVAVYCLKYLSTCLFDTNSFAFVATWVVIYSCLKFVTMTNCHHWCTIIIVTRQYLDIGFENTLWISHKYKAV